VDMTDASDTTPKQLLFIQRYMYGTLDSNTDLSLLVRHDTYWAYVDFIT